MPIRDTATRSFWMFPLLLAGTILVSLLFFQFGVQLPPQPNAADITSFGVWKGTTLIFTLVFAFTIVTVNVLIFRATDPDIAPRLTFWTTVGGVVAVIVFYSLGSIYLGPSELGTYLDQTAFNQTGIKTFSSVLNGFAFWASGLVLAASSAMIHHKVTTAEDLSRQLRATKILLYCASALLVTGMASITALAKWPAASLEFGAKTTTAATTTAATTQLTAQSATPAPTPKESASSKSKTPAAEYANSLIMQAGTLFSLLLAAVYLPLALALRQRAYKLIAYDRAEAWLGIHGFALQPTQQLAKIIMILSPLIVSGPLAGLLSLIQAKP